MKAIICVIVATVLICGGTPAYGAGFFFNPQDPLGNWGSTNLTWYDSCLDGATELVGTPTPGDDATICSSQTCILDIDAEVMTISVLGTGALVIPVGKTLTLNKHEGVSTIDGAIGLNGSIHIIIDQVAGVSEWHQFAGVGHIVGEDQGAKILIQSAPVAPAYPNELILSTTFRGMGEIGKLDPLKNDQMLVLKGGSVIADDHGTMTINTGSMRDDLDVGGNALLEVSKYSDAVMEIHVGCSGTPPLASFCAIFCLEYTDVEILEGTLDLDDTSIETEGDLTMEPGGGVRPRERHGSLFPDRLFRAVKTAFGHHGRR